MPQQRPSKERSTPSIDPEMKHTTSRMLFAYWDSLRGDRASPTRGELEPTRIRHILADTFILATDPDADATFRLAGTRCTALFGRDLKDTSFAELFPRDDEEAARLLDIVTADTVGVVAGLRGWTKDAVSLDLELILLPLRHRGLTAARVLGALSPNTVPSWMGLVPLVSLEIRTTRTIGTGTAAAASTPEPKARDRFVVLEGGRR